MNNFVIYDVKTKDNKNVIVGVQCNGNIDSILANNIVSYIKTNMDVNYAILNSDPCYKNSLITDSSGANREFISCFIMTWDVNYEKIINANLVSFFEK